MEAVVEKINILAVSDVHAPRYLPLYIASLNSIMNYNPDLIVLAGDLVDHGKISYMKHVLEPLTKKFPKTPAIAVFGNEEYIDIEDRIIKNYNQVEWLNDSTKVIEIKDLKIGIVGSRGVIDKPTPWQRRNIEGITEIYRQRVLKIKEMLKDLANGCDVVILVTHYAPTYVTLRGEPINIYPYLGSRELEKVLREAQIDMAIHGHAHNSKVVEAPIGCTRVYNVALPARKSITLIEYHKVIGGAEDKYRNTSQGLLRFVKK